MRWKVHVRFGGEFTGQNRVKRALRVSNWWYLGIFKTGEKELVPKTKLPPQIDPGWVLTLHPTREFELMTGGLRRQTGRLGGGLASLDTRILSPPAKPPPPSPSEAAPYVNMWEREGGKLSEDWGAAQLRKAGGGVGEVWAGSLEKTTELASPIIKKK